MKKDPASRESKRRFFTWRTLRRVVIGFAWAATLIALLYGVENWRCNRAWENYRAAAEARGEHTDWKYFIPPPVPDDQNFAMAGTLPQTLFNADESKIVYPKSDLFFKAGKAQLPKTASVGFHFTDLAAWEKAMTAAARPGAPEYGTPIDVSPDPDPASRTAAAPGVLRLMQDADPLIEELRAASSRPYARYPIHYDAENPATIALPYYSILNVFCQRLRLRACAELAIGRSDEAAADLKLMTYLSDSIRDDSFLIAILVRITALYPQSQVIWEGTGERRWSDAKLAEIEQRLLAENYVAEMKRDLDSEHAVMMAILDYYRAKGDFGFFTHDALYNMSGRDFPTEFFDGRFGKCVLWLVPKGWFQLEKVDYYKAFGARFQNVFDPGAKRIFPKVMEANMHAAAPAPGSDLQELLQHRFVSLKLLGVFGDGLASKAASAQCICDEAAIACALERYRLAKRTYPAQLDALAPGFIPTLPHEITSGDPYHYRLVDADHYSLYSIGWDLKDHGGKPGEKQYGMDGDWVWR
ncbi:MAG TPA: hypothetical protein VG733_14645 [Chthoniobacteraceae bacterium]|nr:hypothetical protein [Chthoniobacteraceae bacterium]